MSPQKVFSWQKKYGLIILKTYNLQLYSAKYFYLILISYTQLNGFK